jgi:carbamoyl-phosphate synthase large subunit
MNKPLTVLVTGVTGATVGSQILKALRLATTKYQIIGCDLSPLSTGLVDVDIPYIVPPAHDPKYVETLLKICHRHNVKAVFVGSDVELKVISAARKVFTDNGVFLPINPESVIDLCFNKIQTMVRLPQLGFLVPKTIIIKSKDDLSKITDFPVVLKPPQGGGSNNVFLAQSTKELFLFGEYLLSQTPIIVIQEYLGNPDSEYTVGVLCDMEGALINSIVIKRHILGGLSNRIKVANSTQKKELGPILAISSGISQGAVVDCPDIATTCESIAQAIGCRSVLNIQCRYVNKKIYVFEINPRFSGTTSARALVGYNEPDILLQTHLLGKKVSQHFTYKKGIVYRDLKEVLIQSQEIPLALNL